MHKAAMTAVGEDRINILVVDDMPEKVLVLDSILAELGEHLIVARSGEEALWQVLQHEFAVILLDVNMPSMDGYETAALIRRRKKSAHTPIIFITGYADEMHKAQGYSLGAVDYILSPVVPDILRTKVRVFIDLYRMAKQAVRHAEEGMILIREQAARTVAEEANRRSSFLAESSATLASSLDYEATVRSLARLPVPFLADLGAVTLASECGLADRTEMAWADPADGAVQTVAVDAASLPAALLQAIGRVLGTGQKERIDPVEDLGTWRAPATGQAGPPLSLGSTLILPLRARNQVLGTLTLSLMHPGRHFGPTETLLGLDLAERAAIFLDNTRLYRNIQEADHRKNEFLAMLGHELRNPLAAIRGVVEVLRIPALAQRKLPWARDVIDRQVTQLTRMVDDLLDVARITQGKIRLLSEPVELKVVVDQAVELSNPLIGARHHRLSVSMPQRSLWVRGDATRLSQVLVNLLNNAAKYMDEGGHIELSVEQRQQRVLLRVRDHGVGIPEHLLGSIFDLFTQANRSLDRSQGGLGIGLTVVRTLVEMHNGSVYASSAGPDQGSEFVVELPLLPDRAAPQAKADTAPHPVVSKGRRVLVVDDNVDVTDCISAVLEDRGHQVRTAHDGLAALSAAQEFCPQVVLLDVGLPGIDGYEVARRMRAQTELQGTLLVAVTGYGQPEERQRSFDAGFDRHLVKPVDAAALLELIESPSIAP